METRNENDPERIDSQLQSPILEEEWRLRVNRLLNRRQLNFRDSESMEADDDELQALTRDAQKLGYKLK